MRRAISLVIGCAAMFACAPSAASAAFSNPVIPGNVADPSVVRADGGYWAAATSGGWAPVFPIFRSRDLVRWRQVGSVFPRAPAWARGNFWAPGLTVRRGRWSVYYSASRRRGKPCIAVAQAARPTGPWRDRGFIVCQRSGSIDAAAVRDAHERRYLVWKRMGVGSGIYGARLGASGRRLLSRPRLLIEPDRPWEEGVTEGPDVVREGGSYVLVYSGGHCCRPPCSYAVGLARAPNVLGPYEKYDGNPVFAGGNGWKCPGHGTLVRAPGGGRAFLHHAYRDDDPFNVHRQALLDPVEPTPDGWLAFGEGGAPVGSGAPPVPLELSDAFAGRALAPGWQWPYDGPPIVQLGGGRLRVFHGTVSRAWAPRDFAAEVRIAGRGRLALLFTGGRKIAVSASRGRVLLLEGARVRGRLPLARVTALRLHVRGGRAVAAYARGRGAGWWRVGAPVVARPGVAVDRVALGPGVFGAVRIQPLR